MYFVSRALLQTEKNYPILEKLVLALVHAARRLRRYFQAHTIEVLSTYPVRQILLKPEKSGRLAKWAIELGEHEIEYRPRNGIKGQALADFLSELPDESLETAKKEGEGALTTVCQAAASGEWKLFSDGASSKEGAGAGLVLVSPANDEITYALKFNFHASNNEAEYEALLAGMKLAIEMGVSKLTAMSDSLLVANQFNGEYDVKDDRMRKYLDCVKSLASRLSEFSITQIPRSKNRKADALSKLASTSFDHLSKRVLVETLHERSIDSKTVATIEDQGPNWMTPYVEYHQHGVLPSDHNTARKLKVKVSVYTIKDGQLYRKGYLTPWLKCITAKDGVRLLEEVHGGESGSHEGARALTGKIIRMGIYWPDMHKNAKEVTGKCMSCQTFAPVSHQPATSLTSIYSPWPFHQWGIDIAGPFPAAPSGHKYIILAIDYFTKWIEAEPTTSITGRKMIKFVWNNIMARYGTPRVLISDNGLQLAEEPFKGWCAARHIKQQFTSVAHPQANGQTEVSNRTIIGGLKRRLGETARGGWTDELPTVLWSYRTTPRTPTGETPFSLTYGTEAVLPAELEVGTIRTTYFNEENNAEELRHNLDLLEEKREIAALRQAAYKSKVEKFYNKRVNERAFRVGDLVMRKNEASLAEPLGKLSPTWEGPYIVVEAHEKGSYILETIDGRAIPRTWNVQNLKRFNR